VFLADPPSTGGEETPVEVQPGGGLFLSPTATLLEPTDDDEVALATALLVSARRRRRVLVS
jgi:hypothetical protein